MITFVAFIIFSAALFGAAYYVFVIPQQQDNQVLLGRLRELRARSGLRTRSSAPDLIRREHRGALASIGDFIQWVGVIRRLQDLIDQADLRYRAAETGSLCLLLFLGVYFLAGVFVPVLLVKLFAALFIAAIPVLYIMWKRNKRLRKFEQHL